MADKLVALIRGINVGRAKRVAMADLRSLVESFGYKDVRTLLNSGNLIFSARATPTDEAASRIENGLSAQLGVPARVTVISAVELAAIADNNPLLDVAHDASRLLVTVLRNPDDRARLASLEQQDWTPEVLVVKDRVAYLWCPHGILASRLPAAIQRVLGDGATTRNWATIVKLHNLTLRPKPT